MGVEPDPRQRNSHRQKVVDKQDPGDPFVVTIDTMSLPVFKKNCPLWTYILAEAMQQQEKVHISVSDNVTITTPKLGAVGGRIVAGVSSGFDVWRQPIHC